MSSAWLKCSGVQAADKAAAQSNREISGYRIESISLTHERQEHYLRKHVGLAGPAGPLASLQPGGSPGIADRFSTYPPAEELGSISGFPSQRVRLVPLLSLAAGAPHPDHPWTREQIRGTWGQAAAGQC